MWLFLLKTRMTEFEQLQNYAFHKEKVASRRLALALGLTELQALRLTLENVAGADGLPALLEARQVQRAADAQRLAARRQEKHQARIQELAKTQAPATAWLAWFDGSARPNPGRCGIGAVLQGPDGEQFEISRAAGYGSSSEAEYLALIAVLELACTLSPAQLWVYGDSRVVIDDLAAQFGAPSLQSYRVRALALMGQIHQLKLRWIPRHKNGLADALSQRASVAAQESC